MFEKNEYVRMEALHFLTLKWITELQYTKQYDASIKQINRLIKQTTLKQLQAFIVNWSLSKITRLYTQKDIINIFKNGVWELESCKQNIKSKKNWNSISLFILCSKNKIKMAEDLNMRVKSLIPTIKYLKIIDNVFSDYFLDMASQEMRNKIKNSQVFLGTSTVELYPEK